LCAEDLLIKDCRPDHIALLIEMLKKSGVQIETTVDTIRVTNKKGAAPFKSFDITTKEYPGFATDLQSPVVTFLTQAEGESKVVETIFEGRFKYTEDLKKMGADISQIGPQEIRIKGPTALKELQNGEELRAHDIRAGFAVVLAALCGTGKFTVNNIHLIDRGYEKLEERLTVLGADIQRVSA
jgi:UDP-N-acetylglucosamine 1-carboxyvinyltransferase